MIANNQGVPNTPAELEMLANNDVQGYYESRLERGDSYAGLALDVVNNQGVLGKSANAWLFTQASVAWGEQSEPRGSLTT